jgi:hypothetical protein
MEARYPDDKLGCWSRQTNTELVEVASKGRTGDEF